MRFSHNLIILCYCLFASCSSVDPIFPHEEILSQELMPLQGITCPVRIEVKHPFLILQNMKRTDSLFHIYDLTNNELKQAFGVIGQVPNEFIPRGYFIRRLQIFLSTIQTV